jgi:hypothetical protein
MIQSASLDDYLRLLPSAHADKPNFLAVLAATLSPAVDFRNAIARLPVQLDLDLATGAQLDLVGQWVGLSRVLKTPIPNVYFSLDTANLGVDQGVWAGANPVEGVISLDDETYRLMLRAKIAANQWDGSLGHANYLLGVVFPAVDVVVKDNFNMTQSLILSGSSPSTLFAQLVQSGYIQLRPAGVGLL